MKEKRQRSYRKKIQKILPAAGFVPCRNPGLNRGPLDLQSNALPTELFRLTLIFVAAYLSDIAFSTPHFIDITDKFNHRHFQVMHSLRKLRLCTSLHQ
jgi:hypothetical protein